MNPLDYLKYAFLLEQIVKFVKRAQKGKPVATELNGLKVAGRIIDLKISVR